MYNLRNRSFLKEVDFTRDELLHLLALAQALKTAKYAGNEVQRLPGKEIALIFEKSSMGHNGLTNEWHPTQMLADFLTMRERTSKPYDEIA